MSDELILGVEGGGSKTSWVLIEGSQIIDQGLLPAANLILISDEHLLELLSQLPTKIDRAGVFLAGCKTEADRARLRRLCEEVWPDAKVVVGSDRESGFAAAFGSEDGITVISGSGSAVTGRKGDKSEKAGGSGHLLGDVGSGFTIGIEGLRSVLRVYDLQHIVTRSAQVILQALMLNRMEDLIEWTQSADKMAVARLSPVVFTAAQHGNRDMLAILEEGATALAKYTASVAKWLEFERPPVKLQGGIFLNQPLYADLYRKALADILPTSCVEVCDTPGAVGAARLAAADNINNDIAPIDEPQQGLEELSRSLTEQVNPRSVGIDKMTSEEMVELFVEEEASVAAAIKSQQAEIAKAIDVIAAAFQNDGRLFYIGAGTSGRLGTLDASEIPPTFGEPPYRVQAIMAGGVNALHSSVEGAEDNDEHGRLSVVERGVAPGDVVCGIAASGRTPFVLAGLKEAASIGAKTILLTCNPNRDRKDKFDVEINLPTGPELVTGSTRLKAGTATKVTLNILTTCAFVRIGKTQGNMMVSMRASNAKLRERAIRMVSSLRGISREEAETKLAAAEWNISKIVNE